MPPKADAKAKAKGKAAAARRPSQAKVQKPGSKKGANVPVEIEIKATLDSALNKGDAPMRVGGIDVTGQHRLSRILVESIVALPFVRGFSKVCLRRISYYPKSPERLGPAPSLSLSPASARSARTKPQSEAIQFIQVEETRAEEVDCPSLFLALCLRIEASKPQLIRVGPAELLAEEARELQKYQDAYGISSAQVQQLPEVVNTRHKHSLMVIPLAGGRCLLPPLSEAAVEDINSFTKIFNDAISATDGPDSAGFISLALQGTQHVCCSVLLQPMLRGCTEELINLTQVFTNLEDIMLGKTHPELSVDYYDGLGANAIGVEKEQIDDFRGGPTSDGVPINELNKMVFDLVPGMKQTRPTEFLAWFHSQMQQSGTFWNLKAIYSTTSAAIDFDAVLQDADGHAFLAPCSCNAQFAQLATLRQNADAALDWKYRHVFSRMARWMLSGLLLHSPIQGPGDLKWLRELCMILAGMPEDLSLSLPPPPDAAPLHLRFAWSFVRRCVRCLRWHNPMMVNGKLVHLPQPGLQMVWALLDAAIELVPDEHTKSYPERKRLALWASLCFAIRLAVACKKMDETGWLADRSKLWGRFDDGIDLEGLAAQVYVTRFGVQESWSRDPVSKETRSVFLDDLPWEVIPLVDTEEDVKTEYPEDLEDPEASVAPWAETVSAAEQAAVLKANAQELDAAQTALKDLEPSMGRQVRKAWESAKRVVVTGGIGQGKRAISKNAMADLTLAELCTEVYRFPVRLKLADLQNRKDCADAIQDFCSSEPASCAACAWERLPPPPWMGRFNHQVICVDGKILVTGGVSYWTWKKTGKHLQDAWISTDGQNWEDLPAAPWPPRSSHQVVWWEDRLILLGGLGDDDRRFRDAWQTTDFGLTWQELPCPKWSGRFGHRCMVLSLAVKAPARPYLVLMGGSGAGNRALKDVWVSDSGGFSWTELEALPCSPRWNFHVANLNQCLWITGGEDENHHCFNDCWVLHGCQWNPKGSGVSASNVSRWKSEATLGEDGWRGPFTAPWSARAQHQVVPFRGQLALFGGCDEKNQVLYDAWVSQDGITWQVLPHFAWAQAAGRAGHQVLTLQDGRSMVFGGLGGGRDVLRSRSLAVVIEDIPPTFAEEEAVVRYLNRLLQEPGHLVMCVTSIPLLERPLQGEEEELNDESVYSLLQRWKFSELHVKPLEETHLRKLCCRWTHGMELSEKVEAEMLLPDNYDLVNSPLMAIMVLRALAPRSRERRDLRHPLTRCQLYEHMFKRIFQSQKAVKAYDDSEFPLLQKQGMATACCELAYEGLGKRSRCIKLHELQAFIASLAGKEVKVEQMERLVKTAHAGQLLLLEDYQQGGLRFRYPSMQDYLAAQCAWVHLVEGKGVGATAEPNPMSQFLHLNMLEALGRLADGIYRLKGYNELNHAALYKILRKWDKVLMRNDGVSQIYPQIIEGTRIGDMSALEALDANVKEAFSQRSPAPNQDISPEVALLAAGLGRRSAGLQGRALQAERFLFFFLGSSSALVVSIIALICLPEKDPQTFSKNYFLCSFPVFRVCLSAVLVILGMACVARVCEDNFINHFFILGIDPRCRVSPNFLFTWAMLLSSAWIFIFGFYVVDYKWMVLPLVWASSTRLERASWHYVLYPTVLLGLTVALLLRPSYICRCKWKLQLLRGIGRTCLAPFYFVNFGDNMVGDVLTSLARPLRDVPAAFCYLSSHHPQLRSSMERFVNSGNTCPAWEHLIVSPLIAALPFWFRLLQCARRFYDTGQKRHLLNLGKYASSLMVVVVSSPGWPIWTVVLASAIATVYAAWWDVCMDWGLTYTELCFLTRSGGGSRYVSPMHSPAGPGFPNSPAQSFHSVTLRSQPGGHASRPSVGQYTRHFSARIYCLAVLGDIVLRCTWVITLMPITLLGKGVVWREILHVFMTVAEIFRRSFWAILRIEYEQVANASGYRALLWVPMKVGQKVGGDASAHGFRQSLLPG